VVVGLMGRWCEFTLLQWLCNADTSRAEPRVRLKRFFTSLYNSLTRGARAVLQLYPVRPQRHGTQLPPVRV
jgi:hypothetical protein